MSAAKWVC